MTFVADEFHFDGRAKVLTAGESIHGLVAELISYEALYRASVLGAATFVRVPYRFCLNLTTFASVFIREIVAALRRLESVD